MLRAKRINFISYLKFLIILMSICSIFFTLYLKFLESKKLAFNFTLIAGKNEISPLGGEGFLGVFAMFLFYSILMALITFKPLNMMLQEKRCSLNDLSEKKAENKITINKISFEIWENLFLIPFAFSQTLIYLFTLLLREKSSIVEITQLVIKYSLIIVISSAISVIVLNQILKKTKGFILKLEIEEFSEKESPTVIEDGIRQLSLKRLDLKSMFKMFYSFYIPAFLFVALLVVLLYVVNDNAKLLGGIEYQIMGYAKIDMIGTKFKILEGKSEIFIPFLAIMWTLIIGLFLVPILYFPTNFLLKKFGGFRTKGIFKGLSDNSFQIKGISLKSYCLINCYIWGLPIFFSVMFSKLPFKDTFIGLFWSLMLILLASLLTFNFVNLSLNLLMPINLKGNIDSQNTQVDMENIVEGDDL